MPVNENPIMTKASFWHRILTACGIFDDILRVCHAQPLALINRMITQSPFHHRCAALAVLAASVSSPLWADSLSPTTGFTPVFTFTETHTEKMVVVADPVDPTVKYAEAHAVDAMNLCIKASMSGQALADVGPDTGFSLDLGDLSVQFSLSDDPNYKSGDTSAFFPTHGWDANNKPIGTEGLALSWTADVLTIKMVNSANTEEDQGPFFPAFSQNYIGVTNDSIRALGEVNLTFGTITGDATVYLKGTAATATQHFANGDFSDDIDVTQASLSGELDFAPPTVAITGTSTAGTTVDPNSVDGTTSGVTVSGTSVDGHGVASVQVTTTPEDDSSWQDANIDSSTPLADGDEWSADTVHWSFDLSDAGIGSTVISVRSTDLSGNVSAPATFTVVRDVPPSLAGRWDALVSSEDSGIPSGIVTFTVSTAGYVTGKLTLADSGRTFPFTGTWSGDTITGTIVRPGLTSLVFSATAPSIDVSDAADAWLDGTLTEIPAVVATTAGAKKAGASIKTLITVDPPVVIDPLPPVSAAVVGVFGAFRSPFSAANPVSSDLVGRYNASVSGPQVDAALGTSFLTLNARPTGSTLIVGRLSDGTPFSWSGRLGASGQVPVYVPLYSRKGLLSALLNIDGQTLSADTGVWQRPAGVPDGQFPDGFLADSLSVDGQLYTAPVSPDRVLGLADGTDNANITLSGDGLDSDINVWFTVDAQNHATFDAPNAEGLRTSFARLTGNVTGAFKLPDGGDLTTSKTIVFRGLIVGDQAVGFYVAPPAPSGTAKRYGSLTISGDQASQASGGENNSFGGSGGCIFTSILPIFQGVLNWGSNGMNGFGHHDGGEHHHHGDNPP